VVLTHADHVRRKSTASEEQEAKRLDDAHEDPAQSGLEEMRPMRMRSLPPILTEATRNSQIDETLGRSSADLVADFRSEHE
jgi:hypothetical protein